MIGDLTNTPMEDSSTHSLKKKNKECPRGQLMTWDEERGEYRCLNCEASNEMYYQAFLKRQDLFKRYAENQDDPELKAQMLPYLLHDEKIRKIQEGPQEIVFSLRPDPIIQRWIERNSNGKKE